MSTFDFSPDPRLTLKVAETRDELEACFRLLHDAYVEYGYMRPHRSGMRITPYHALPTTTTLCAKYDGEVVGTISLIRDGVFGFPVQRAFDLQGVRLQGGLIAEASALAVAPRFRKSGGKIVFPLIKFKYEYCTRFFGTRHLVVAVHPKHIKFYESLLFLKRLQEKVVDRYDFVNGAPAVAGSVDLHGSARMMRQAYASKPWHRNLATYLLDFELPNIEWPTRGGAGDGTAVMAPELLDHFFNHSSSVLRQMDRRQIALLHSIYHDPAYRSYLPPLHEDERGLSLTRKLARHPLQCPAMLSVRTSLGGIRRFRLDVVDASINGFQARINESVPLRTWGRAKVELGSDQSALITAVAVRQHETDGQRYVAFQVSLPDSPWRALIHDLERGRDCEARPMRPLQALAPRPGLRLLSSHPDTLMARQQAGAT